MPAWLAVIGGGWLYTKRASQEVSWLTGCKKRRAWVSKAVSDIGKISCNFPSALILTTHSQIQFCQHLIVAMCTLARAAACNTGQALLKKKYMIRVHGCEQQDGNFGEGKDTMDALYRLLEDDSALNAGQTATCSPMQGTSGPDKAWSVHVSHFRFTLSSVFQHSTNPCPFFAANLAYDPSGFAWVCGFKSWNMVYPIKTSFAH